LKYGAGEGWRSVVREKRRIARAREENNILRTIKRRKVTSCIETAF